MKPKPTMPSEEDVLRRMLESPPRPHAPPPKAKRSKAKKPAK